MACMTSVMASSRRDQPHLLTAKPAAQKGSENSAMSTPPPARAPTVHTATNAFQAMAKAPVNSDSPAGSGFGV